jgi:hypothetical protein
MAELFSATWSFRDEAGIRCCQQKVGGVYTVMLSALAVTAVPFGLALLPLGVGESSLLVSLVLWVGLGLVVSAFLHPYVTSLFREEEHSLRKTVLVVFLTEMSVLLAPASSYWLIGGLGLAFAVVMRLLVGRFLGSLVCLQLDPGQAALIVFRGPRRQSLPREQVSRLEMGVFSDQEYFREREKELLGDQDPEDVPEEGDACEIHQLRLVLRSGEFIVLEEFLGMDSEVVPAYPFTGSPMQVEELRKRFEVLAQALELPLIERSGDGKE